MRCSTTHFSPTSSWNVSNFYGLHQPDLVRSVNPVASQCTAVRTAAVGVPLLGLAATGTGDILSFATSAAVRSTSPLKKRPLTRGGKKFGNWMHAGNGLRLIGSASSMETKALRAMITCQIDGIFFYLRMYCVVRLLFLS
jgi:hypothetical protein